MAPELRTERELSLDFLRVTEAAAIAAARTMGQGDRKYSDQVAVEAMREVMDSVPMRGRIVIGEGERDEAPMLYIGEEVAADSASARRWPRRVPRWTLPSILWKAPTCARSAQTTRSRYSLPPNAVVCCTRRIFTWTRSSLGHRRAA